MKKIVIIGAGGFGREVAWLIERINQESLTWDLLGFVDDDENLVGQEFSGYKVLGNLQWLKMQSPNIYAVCAIGNSEIRKKIITELAETEFATLIDPTVQKSKSVEVGEGTIICANSIITVDVKIGGHVIVNLACTIGHDALIGDFVTLYPSVNISGNTKIQEIVEVGTGAQIIQGLNLASNTTIGAGAVVVKNILCKGVYVGIPAKKV